MPPLNQGTPALTATPIETTDRLRISIWNSLNNLVVRITVRTLSESGQIGHSQYDFTPNSDRSLAEQTFPLITGWLLNVTIEAVTGTPVRGHTFCVARLQKGTPFSSNPFATLISDYLQTGQSLAWPGGTLRQSLEGPGRLNTFTDSDPAAGAQWTVTVPTNARWRLLSIFAVLTTDANAANREIRFSVIAGGFTIANYEARAVQVASTTRIYTFSGSGFSNAAIGAVVQYPITPNILLQQAASFGTVGISFQAGDNWQAPIVHVEEWLEE